MYGWYRDNKKIFFLRDFYYKDYKDWNKVVYISVKFWIYCYCYV